VLVTRILLLAAATLCPSAAVAQTTLGALLDAGAKHMSVADFNAVIVQRILVGPTFTGGALEIMYARNGTVQGTGTPPRMSGLGLSTPQAPVQGEWWTEGSLKICTTMRISAGAGGGTTGMQLPSRCQYWFRLGTQFFLADSDTDRSAKVLPRTIKQ
jgi:hypothetical protein